MSSIKSIAIVGGTHGNELTGIHTVQALANNHTSAFTQIFDISYTIANPPAVAKNTRFVDVDLNRQFGLENLAATDCISSDSPLSELNIAKQLNQQLGPKQHAKTDLVIDIHNTTSAMGATLILLEDSPFYRNMGGYLKAHMPSANILLEDEIPYLEHPYLCTIGQRGIMLELGAQPQGVSRMDIFLQCAKMLEHILAYCDLYNQHTLPEIPEFTAYRLLDVVEFPLDDTNEVAGLVHENLLDRDYEKVAIGEPIFRMFDGTEVLLTGEHAIYPHFINEAAYKNSKVAFASALKFKW